MNLNTDVTLSELQKINSEKDWLQSQLQAWIKTAQTLQQNLEKQNLNQNCGISNEYTNDIDTIRHKLQITELQLHQTQEELKKAQVKLNYNCKKIKLVELQLYQAQEELEKQHHINQQNQQIENIIGNIKSVTNPTQEKKNKPAYDKINTSNNKKNIQLTYQECFKIAKKFRQQDDVEQAIQHYLQAIEINPRKLECFQAIINILKYKKCSINMLSRIKQTCCNSIAKGVYHPFSHILIARVLTEQGKVNEALEYYQQGIYQKTLNNNPNFVKKYWHSGKQKGPNYIIIGAPKCATTSLEQYLSNHPQVLAPIAKELGYFGSKLFKQNSDYYFAHFPPIPQDGKFITGEGDPTYLYKKDAAKQIYSTIPNVKLILMLRNPLNRTISQYYHWVRLGLETQSLESLVDSEIKLIKKSNNICWEINNKLEYGYILNSLYLFFIKHWLNYFPREQILILTTENLKNKPYKTMNQVYQFLEITENKINFSKKYNTGSYDSVEPKIKNKLADFFKPYNRQLEEYLGMEFNW